MPVQTVVARRRELENAIIAVEREAARSDTARPPAPSLHETALIAAVTGAIKEAPAPVEEPAYEIEIAAKQGEEDSQAYTPAEEPVEVSGPVEAPDDLASAKEPDAASAMSPPIANEPEMDANVGAHETGEHDRAEYDESVDYAPPPARRPILLYAGVLTLVICAVAVAAAVIGIAVDEAQAPAAAAKSTVRLVASPPDPATELIKGAGFQGAAQGSLKEASGFLERRDYDRAIASLDDAIRLDPDAAPAYANRAFAHWNKGNVEAAIRDYGAAIERDPANTANRLNRAVALNRKGEHQAAVDDLDRVIAAEPANAIARNSRCWAHAVLAHLEEALADCNEALKLKPDDADTLASRGFVYLRLGRLDRAIDDYSAVLKNQPKHAGSLYGRGLAKLGRGDRAGGNEDVQAARAVDPDIVAAYARYGIR
jgi:tetratricopeptide (TPR) repeat protein